MNKKFGIDLLIDIAVTLDDNKLCSGCSEKNSPFSYKNGGSCYLCRKQASKEIIKILKRVKQNDKK